jgi:hypothetical protein
MPARTYRPRRPTDSAAEAKAERMIGNLRRLHQLGSKANADTNELPTDEFAAEVAVGIVAVLNPC